MRKVHLEKFLSNLYKRLRSKKIYRVKGSISDRPLFTLRFVNFGALYPKYSDIYGFHNDGLWARHVRDNDPSVVFPTVWSPNRRTYRVLKTRYDLIRKKLVIEVTPS